MFKGFGRGGKDRKDDLGNDGAPETPGASGPEAEGSTEGSEDAPAPIEGGLPTPEGEFTSVTGGLPSGDDEMPPIEGVGPPADVATPVKPPEPEPEVEPAASTQDDSDEHALPAAEPSPELPAAAVAPPAPARQRPRISFAMFTDPTRRVRTWVWVGAGLLGLAAFVIAALGVTSTYWFCANGCHKVQDDTIIAFDSSTHAEVSCMACHMPVGASPVTFMLHKAEALGELYLTVTNQFELPLNPENHVALEMASTQCTQCHGPNRDYTFSAGIVMNHGKHAEEDVDCTICHNRTAHPEDFELTLPDNTKHADWMTMTACFRCHSQEPDPKAPGQCEVCHTQGFDLVPAFHKEPGFFPEEHGELAKAEASKTAEASGSAEATGEAGAEASGENAPEGEAGEEELPPVDSINQCYTCHTEKWCTDCHGFPMPHPADFEEAHGEFGKKNAAKCANCHGASGETVCDQCHHGASIDYEYATGTPWIEQHFVAVQQTGANACFQCHDPTYCAKCHVRGSAE